MTSVNVNTAQNLGSEEREGFSAFLSHLDRLIVLTHLLCLHGLALRLLSGLQPTLCQPLSANHRPARCPVQGIQALEAASGPSGLGIPYLPYSTLILSLSPSSSLLPLATCSSVHSPHHGYPSPFTPRGCSTPLSSTSPRYLCMDRAACSCLPAGYDPIGLCSTTIAHSHALGSAWRLHGSVNSTGGRDPETHRASPDSQFPSPSATARIQDPRDPPERQRRKPEETAMGEW